MESPLGYHPWIAGLLTCGHESGRGTLLGGQFDWGLTRGPNGGCDHKSGERFTSAAITFLHTLRRRNPKAHLVWAYGMYGQIMRPWIEEAVRRFQNAYEDTHVSFLLLTETSLEQLGSNNHPGPTAHLTAADALTKALSAVLTPHQ